MDLKTTTSSNIDKLTTSAAGRTKAADETPTPSTPAQDKGSIVEVKKQGYYYDVILPDGVAADERLLGKPPRVKFAMDLSHLDLPNNIKLYQRQWANAPESQGSTGTCWCYCTTSFFESEVFRLTGQKVEISEMHTVYWEYVEKARRFVQERGRSRFSEGSEGNAVPRIFDMHGVVPKSAFPAQQPGREFHSHKAMFKEMDDYLKGIKDGSAWNEKAVLGTIESILQHYLGKPPADFEVDGKQYTPKTYLTDYLQIDTGDYVGVMSNQENPFWSKGELKVPDNWWHSTEYYNVPIEDFMKMLKHAQGEGMSMSIGGDISEAGFDRKSQCAVVPSFDIPFELINDAARQFRVSNGSSTDDHGMHVVGLLEDFQGDGMDWFLFKDSGSGSRDKGPDAPEFGYYFVREDYVKLKMNSTLVHKDAAAEILKKFE